jgi:hypothetical protein
MEEVAAPRDPDALLGYARFALGAFYLGFGLVGFFAFSEAHDWLRWVANAVSYSALLMWCVVDSMRRRAEFPYGLWWYCFTPLVLPITVEYLWRTRGRSVLGKVLGHFALALLVAISCAVIGVMWL